MMLSKRVRLGNQTIWATLVPNRESFWVQGKKVTTFTLTVKVNGVTEPEEVFYSKDRAMAALEEWTTAVAK